MLILIMSFKYQAQRVTDFEWLLEKGVSTPISIFMNQVLYDGSEEEMWLQATWATNIPSVLKIIITPDAHAGAGVPVGVVVATKDHIAPCAAGYDISCFTKDTKVALADGRNLSFEDLIKEHEQGRENYCFSLDENANIVMSKVENPRKTKNVNQLARITLDNNEQIECTLDEVFYSRNNEEIQAKDLKIGQSLMPLYIDLIGNIPIDKRPSRSKKKLLKKYLGVYNPATDRYNYIHYLADEYNIVNSIYEKKFNIRHHKNFNKLDNNPTNIQRMQWKDHWLLHSSVAKQRADAGEIGFKKAHKLYPEFYSKMASENMIKLHQRPGFTEKCKENFIKGRDEYLKSDDFFIMTRDAGKRGKKYLLKYNTSEKGRNKSSEVAHRKYLCLLCSNVLEGGVGIINHFRQKHDIKKYQKTDVKRLNHKVLNFEIIECENIPVYCMTITKYHNFALASGVFVHNCGMLSMKTNLTVNDIRSKEIRRAWIKAVEDRIATGAGYHRMPKQIDISKNLFDEILQYGLHAFKYVSNNVKERFEKTHHQVTNYVRYKRAIERGSGQLSSLGGGNHFLELQQDDQGLIWVMIHTGSRGYGHQIASDFFDQGLEWWNLNHTQKLARKDKELINFPVDSVIGKKYLNAMNQAANFAIVNRYLICLAVQEAIEEVFKKTSEIYYEISHNLVQQENGLWIHRKGATRALPAGHSLLKDTQFEKTGHPILIPGSMGTSSALLMPVDSAKSLYSVNHGCGRVMSRKFAKKTFNQEILDKEMDDLDIICNNRHIPMDESLHCYKDIDEVLNTVEGANLAKVSHKLYPRAVIKGND